MAFVNSFGLKPFTCVNSFSPGVNSVNSFLILSRVGDIQEILCEKPFTPFTTPGKTLHKTLHNCSQPFTLWLIWTQKKSIKRDFEYLRLSPQRNSLHNNYYQEQRGKLND